MYSFYFINNSNNQSISDIFNANIEIYSNIPLKSIELGLQKDTIAAIMNGHPVLAHTMCYITDMFILSTIAPIKMCII